MPPVVSIVRRAISYITRAHRPSPLLDADLARTSADDDDDVDDAIADGSIRRPMTRLHDPTSTMDACVLRLHSLIASPTPGGARRSRSTPPVRSSRLPRGRARVALGSPPRDGRTEYRRPPSAGLRHPASGRVGLGGLLFCEYTKTAPCTPTRHPAAMLAAVASTPVATARHRSPNFRPSSQAVSPVVLLHGPLAARARHPCLRRASLLASVLASLVTRILRELAYGSHTRFGLRPILAATRQLAYGSTGLRPARLRLDCRFAASRLRLHPPTAGSLRSTGLRPVTALRAAPAGGRLLPKPADNQAHRDTNANNGDGANATVAPSRSLGSQTKAQRNENRHGQKTAKEAKKKRTLQTKPFAIAIGRRPRTVHPLRL